MSAFAHYSREKQYLVPEAAPLTYIGRVHYIQSDIKCQEMDKNYI